MGGIVTYTALFEEIDEFASDCGSELGPGCCVPNNAAVGARHLIDIMDDPWRASAGALRLEIMGMLGSSGDAPLFHTQERRGVFEV